MGQVANRTGGRTSDTLHTKGWKSEVLTQTLTGTFTMDAGMPPIINVDPGGATRIVLMPLATGNAGLQFRILNAADAAEDLTIKDSTNTTTFGTISQNEIGDLICTGSTWRIGIGTTT